MVDKNGRLLAELVEQKGFFGTTIFVIKHDFAVADTEKGV